MKRKSKYLPAFFMAGMLALAGCSTNKPASPSPVQDQDKTSSSEQENNTADDNIDLQGTALQNADQNLSEVNGNALITKSGDWNLTGSLNGTLVVDAEDQDVTLHLNGVSIQAANPAIYVKKAKSVTIELTGENTLKSTDGENAEVLNAAVYSKSDLIINGNGSMNVSSASGHGIKAKDSLQVQGISGTITAKSDGIHTNEDAVIDASLQINAEDEGIQSEQALEIKGGQLTIASAGDCLRAETTLSGAGGTHTLNSSENEGIESKDTLLITGGTWTVNASDDGMNAKNLLQIDDGTITVCSANNDGLDSNGSLLINGGTITVLARTMPEEAFDTDNTPFEINGGTVIGIGPSAIFPTAQKQNVLMIGGSGNIDSLSLQDGQGKTLFEFKDSADFLSSNQQAITLSSPLLTTGLEVHILINGSDGGTVTIENGVTQLGTIQSMGGPGGKGGQQKPGGMRPGNNGDNTGSTGDTGQTPPPDAELNPPIDRQ